MAQALALGRALDEAGDVGHDQLEAVVGPHHAEVRLERGEGVVGDLGLGRRDAGDQRGLADVREARRAPRRPPASAPGAASAPRPPRPARRSWAPAAGSTGSRRCPARPARPGRPASGRPPTPGRPGRSRRGPCTTVPSGTATTRSSPRWPCCRLPRPWAPFGGPAVRVVAEGQQRGHVAVGDQPDVAALAAVAAVGAAPGDVRLAPEGDAARAAVAASDVEAAFVDELGARPP